MDLSIVLIAIGAFGIALNDGVERMAAIVNPFNVLNILAIVVLFIPALVASRWARSLENAALRADDQAQRLVNEAPAATVYREGRQQFQRDEIKTDT